MAATDLASGYATITAIAALANPRNVPGSKKKLILDAEIFVGGEKCETLLGALSFFNKSDMNFEHSGIALYLIYSTVSTKLISFHSFQIAAFDDRLPRQMNLQTLNQMTSPHIMTS